MPTPTTPTRTSAASPGGAPRLLFRMSLPQPQIWGKQRAGIGGSANPAPIMIIQGRGLPVSFYSGFTLLQARPLHAGRRVKSRERFDLWLPPRRPVRGQYRFRCCPSVSSFCRRGSPGKPAGAICSDLRESECKLDTGSEPALEVPVSSLSAPVPLARRRVRVLPGFCFQAFQHRGIPADRIFQFCGLRFQSQALLTHLFHRLREPCVELFTGDFLSSAGCILWKEYA